MRGHEAREQLYAGEQVIFSLEHHSPTAQPNECLMFSVFIIMIAKVCLIFPTFLPDLLLLGPSCIHSFNRCLSSTYFVPENVFGVLRIAQRIIDIIPWGGRRQ